MPDPLRFMGRKQVATATLLIAITGCSTEDPTEYHPDGNASPDASIAPDGAAHARPGDVAMRPPPAPSFASKLNPTGEPIGGGPGYTDTVSQADADYVVHTATELIDALSAANVQAKSGLGHDPVVFIPGHVEIDLTEALSQTPRVFGNGKPIYPDWGVRIEALDATSGHQWGTVTIASDRGHDGSAGARLYLTNKAPAKSALFVVEHANVRFTGLRLHGASDTEGRNQPRQGGILTKLWGFDLEVDNCEIAFFSDVGVQLGPSDNAYIHHNYIHHVWRSGHGYGVWVGGSLKRRCNALNFAGTCEKGNDSIAQPRECEARLEANLFDMNRHSIASASNPSSSWRARYNVVLDRGTSHALDRHSDCGRQRAGHNTFIENNWLWRSSTRIRGSAWGQVTFRYNWVDAPSLPVSVYSNTTPEDGNPAWFHHKEPTSNGPLRDTNRYGGHEAIPPVAVINIYDDRGQAYSGGAHPGDVLQFNGEQSHDPNAPGISPRSYHWHISDGEHTAGFTSSVPSFSYAFPEVGAYRVELFVTNSAGVPSRRAARRVVIEPRQPSYILSAWVKDTYLGDKPGHFAIQLLVTDLAAGSEARPQVVWQRDIAGKAGWQHAVVDITDHITVGSSTRISYRLRALRNEDDNFFAELESRQIAALIDDVHVFGTGDLLAGDFEGVWSSPGWSKASEGTWSVSVGPEARSGGAAGRIAITAARFVAGQWGELRQSVPVLPLAPPPTTPCVAALPTPIAWWSFDTDPAMTSNGVTLQGNAVRATPGAVGTHSLRFAGGTSMHGRHYSSQLHALTISAWVKVHSSWAHEAQVLISDTTTSNRGWLVYLDSQGRVTFQTKGKAGGIATARVVNPKPIDDGIWHHVVAIREPLTPSVTGYPGTGTGALLLYVDGVQANVAGFYDIDATDDSGSVLRLGRATVPGDSRLTGELDEIAIFGEALTSCDVASLRATR